MNWYLIGGIAATVYTGLLTLLFAIAAASGRTSRWEEEHPPIN